jgi:esterase/lipase
MNKVLFVVTGFLQEEDHADFKWMRRYYSNTGYVVKMFAPTWKHRVMTDYVEEFSEFYIHNKGGHNAVLGFSFGAMIASISAATLRPNVLVLCSLSPYFKEDLRHLTPYMKRTIGVRRYKDFVRYSSKKLAAKLRVDSTTVLYGTTEAKRYPQLKKRCVDVHKAVSHSTLIEVPDAPHKISHPEYVRAIKSVL